ncbi:deaminase, partial [Nocardia farcinica]|uniref:deaminase n=1 Tax=Nocardia farcinica TaxID=37329 RepID=UPI0024560911
MTAVYTFDVFTSLDGFGSYGPDGDWGGYWGKHGPEFLDHRLAQMIEDQRMVLGANTFREFVEMIGAVPDLDPINARMRSMPTTVVSTTLTDTAPWPDATHPARHALDKVPPHKAEKDQTLRENRTMLVNAFLSEEGEVSLYSAHGDA